MPLNFKHLNASEQVVDGTITTSLFADDSVTTAKINIDANLSFNEFQALALRLENVSMTPAPGNIGRVVWNTSLNEVLVDTGIAFVPISTGSGVTSIHADANPNLTGNIQLVSGTNVTLSQVGQAITINSTGGSSGVTSIQADGGALETGAIKFVSGTNITIVDSPAGTFTINSSSGTFSPADLTDVGTDGITITGGINAVNGSGTSISQHVADSTHNGYLSSTDWSTFNGKLSVSNFVTREVPSGTINSSNATFTLANTPIVGTECLYLNGLLQNVGVSNDYTISGSIITFIIAPETGDILLANYQK